MTTKEELEANLKMMGAEEVNVHQFCATCDTYSLVSELHRPPEQDCPTPSDHHGFAPGGFEVSYRVPADK